MILTDYEDLTRYAAPPEPTPERDEEPEDHIDWLDENFPEPPNTTTTDQ